MWGEMEWDINIADKTILKYVYFLCSAQWWNNVEHYYKVTKYPNLLPLINWTIVMFIFWAFSLKMWLWVFFLHDTDIYTR